jgi:hypothetical protein
MFFSACWPLHYRLFLLLRVRLLLLLLLRLVPCGVGSYVCLRVHEFNT